MESKDIILYIQKNAEKIKEEHVLSLVPILLPLYEGKIKSLVYTINKDVNEVSIAAYREYARQAITTGLHTFLFKKQHWKDNRNIGSYLSACIKFKITNENQNKEKKFLAYKCPVCSIVKLNLEILERSSEDNSLRCAKCEKESDRLSRQKTRTITEENQYRLHKIFSKHSKNGSNCPECNQFIPASHFKDKETTSCIYGDCSWFGSVKDLIEAEHPKTKTTNASLSLDYSKSNSINDKEGKKLGDFIQDKNTITPDSLIEMQQKYQKEHEVVKKVLESQKKKFDNNSISGLKKAMMYQAFEDILKLEPEDLTAYLATNKRMMIQKPIQSMVFQQYIKLIEDKLPIKQTTVEGKTREIYSLMDESLELFIGKSEFDTFVSDTRIIGNKTHEIFVGAKCNGSCFIGHLCDVVDINTNKSILSDVDYYTFSYVKMKTTLPNTIVRVIHFRIPPHYEMFSLVPLQRTRRKIVDSVYKRLYGEVRPLRNNIKGKL